MNERVVFPSAGPTVLLAIAAIAAFVLLIAAGVVLYQRIRAQTAQRRQAWQAAEKIIAEHGFDANTAETIRQVLRRNAPDNPVAVLTTREGFERCIAREMDALINTGDQNVIEKAGNVLRLVRAELGLEHVPTGQRILSTRELYHSQWIEISVPGASPRVWVRCMIEDVDEAFVTVSFRGAEGQPAPRIDPGDEIRCRLWRDDDARYYFRTTVAVLESNPPAWRLLHTHRLERQQERAHYRLRHEQDATIGVFPLPPDGAPIPPGARPMTRLRGRITNLSAGGCALVVGQPVSKQVQLRVPFEIPGRDQPLEATIAIVGTVAISGGRVLVRGTFVNLSDPDRDDIAKYVLKRQQRKIAEENRGAIQ